MVIEIAKDDLMPQRRRSDAVPLEPAIRRMRWGSLKSRSYDHAGDRRRRGNPPPASYPQNYGRPGPTVMPGAPLYSSLDRREYSLPPHIRQYDRAPEPVYPSSRGYGISAGRSYGSHAYPVSARDYPKRDIPYDQPGAYDAYEGPARDYRRTTSDEYGARDPYHWDYPPEAKDPRDFKDERDYRYDHPPYEDERYPPSAQRSALRRDYQRYPDQSQWNSSMPPEQYEPPMQQQPQAQAMPVPPVRYSQQQQQQMMPPDDR